MASEKGGRSRAPKARYVEGKDVVNGTLQLDRNSRAQQMLRKHLPVRRGNFFAFKNRVGAKLHYCPRDRLFYLERRVNFRLGVSSTSRFVE